MSDAEKQQENTRVIGRPFPKGVSGNPAGRPKGKSMKEFAREFLMSMSDADKLKFLNSLSKDIVWRMAEGNPHQTTDITSGDKPIPLFGVQNNLINKEDSETSETNTGGAGGNVSKQDSLDTTDTH